MTKLITYEDDDFVRIFVGDCVSILDTMQKRQYHTCITSPPYFSLRNYNHPEQIGLEKTPEEYIEKLVGVFRKVKEVLRDDGTLWLNLGDSFAAKDLLMIPARVALALQSDGWHIRSHIIWHKPNVMPENVKDRPTGAHESIFLLTKSLKYHYDAEAVMEEAICDRVRGRAAHPDRISTNGNTGLSRRPVTGNRNMRNVWSINTGSYKGAHFATFPEDLIKPCIKAGCPKGGYVLDPFGGSGTTGAVARDLGRRADLIELNPVYSKLASERIGGAEIITDVASLPADDPSWAPVPEPLYPPRTHP
jgi:DNA modification methylase